MSIPFDQMENDTLDKICAIQWQKIVSEWYGPYVDSFQRHYINFEEVLNRFGKKSSYISLILLSFLPFIPSFLFI